MNAVRTFKRWRDSRAVLGACMESDGLRDVAASVRGSDHVIAACAAALAAWKWEMKESAWLHQAELPTHPFDLHVDGCRNSVPLVVHYFPATADGMVRKLQYEWGGQEASLTASNQPAT